MLAKLQAIDEGLYFEFSTRDGKSELLKPKVGLARSITWEGHVIDVSEVVFEPLEDEKSGDFGIRLLVPDLAEDKRESAHNGLLRVLDHALGERRFAEEIEFTEVDTLDADSDDYIPLSALDRFIDWRNEKKKAKHGKKPTKKATAKRRAPRANKAARLRKR